MNTSTVQRKCSVSDRLCCSASPAEPQYMRVMHDFTSRNNKELTIRKGTMVEASVHGTKRGSLSASNVTAEPSLPAAAGHVEAVVEGARR